VNAVLRTISRKRAPLYSDADVAPAAQGFHSHAAAVLRAPAIHPGLPPRPVDPADRPAVLDYFSITLSHPRWLASRWLDRLGFERAEQWLLFNNRPAPLTLRANRLRTTPAELRARLEKADVMARPGLFAPDALIVEQGHPLREPGADEGSFVVQDEASQLVNLLVGSDAGPAVLDACASPGGKATAFAAATSGRVVACDVRDRRMALLRRTIEAAGATNVRLVQADLTAGLPFSTRFSSVVVDAPCSGIGILRRDPDIRWRRHESDLTVFAAAQHRMLINAAAVVAPGGRLVYATCSSEPEEDERIAEAFLSEVPDFVPIDARHVHPAMPAACVDTRGHLRTLPDQHGLEAFFGAVFERTKEPRTKNPEPGTQL
jgi:16S rRNA (cytosine967-C5)-methyltransferase